MTALDRPGKSPPKLFKKKHYEPNQFVFLLMEWAKYFAEKK